MAVKCTAALVELLKKACVAAAELAGYADAKEALKQVVNAVGSSAPEVFECYFALTNRCPKGKLTLASFH